MGKKNNIFVNFENVTLDIKNLTNEPRFFKKNKTEDLISKKLLNNINLKINYGDKIGIIGPNGSGKSTLLRLIAQIYKPTSGLLETRGNCIGYFGDIFLNDYITGWEHIYNTLLLYGKNSDEINFSKKDIEDFVSLGHYINKPIISYSEGMKARVSICGVLYSNPDILLIDEGIGAGDRFFVEKARKTIDLKLKSSPILFVASHSEELLRNFCDKIIILVSGNIVKYSNTEDALRYYASEDFKKNNLLNVI
jgi:ABC-2 type transport system ATP-binding protein/lipopolysaccharide transport system ATP-binding protein